MSCKLFTLYYFLLACLLTSCLPDIEEFIPTPVPSTSSQSVFFIYRLELPAFVGFSEDFQITQEIPFSYPVSCGLYNTFPAPIGRIMAIELSCPNGQSVLFLDTETGTITLPFTNTDSHFLAWQSDGLAVYSKVDSLSKPRIVRAYVKGGQDALPIPEFTYDLSAKPDSRDFTYTLSRGLGFGSELYLAKDDGRETQLLYADPFNYISFARFSPDGKQIAFIKIPDTPTPFTVGELWVIPSTGSGQSPSTTDFANDAPSSAQGGRYLANADAGHGYAANWSPDGKKIAFVKRENPEDENANQSSETLLSNIYVIDVESGVLTQITNFTEGHAETPYWSPDGNTLTFNVVINGRMTVSIADVESGEIRSLVTESACCPAWMRK